MVKLIIYLTIIIDKMAMKRGNDDVFCTIVQANKRARVTWREPLLKQVREFPMWSNRTFFHRQGEYWTYPFLPSNVDMKTTTASAEGKEPVSEPKVDMKTTTASAEGKDHEEESSDWVSTSNLEMLPDCEFEFEFD